jgi:hypothetical protein
MPPKKSTKAPNEGSDDPVAGESAVFTPAEGRIINAVLKHATGSVRTITKWDAVAAELSSASSNSTRERFRQISKKYGWFEAVPVAGEDTTVTPTPKKQKAPASKTKKARTLSDVTVAEGPEDDDEESPTKKHKKSASKKAKSGEKQSTEATTTHLPSDVAEGEANAVLQGEDDDIKEEVMDVSQTQVEEDDEDAQIYARYEDALLQGGLTDYF